MARGRSDLGAGLVRTRRGQRHGGDPAAARARRRPLCHQRPEDLVEPRRFADWGFGLFRTDQGSSRHKGLSFILFDLNTPGVTRRPIRQLHGDPGFAELFFDDVRVPVENRIAGEGEGWNVAMATAGFERGLMLRSPGRFQATAATARRACCNAGRRSRQPRAR